MGVTGPIVMWQLGPERASEWRRIRLRALKGEPQAFCSIYQDWAQRPLADFAARLVTGHVMAAGRKQGLPLAVAALDRAGADPATGILSSIYCLPAARGCGFSEALLMRLIADARDLKLRELRLSVVADNVTAIRFYLRLGFVDTGVDQPRTPTELRQIEMAMPLHPA